MRIKNQGCKSLISIVFRYKIRGVLMPKAIKPFSINLRKRRW